MENNTNFYYFLEKFASPAKSQTTEYRIYKISRTGVIDDFGVKFHADFHNEEFYNSLEELKLKDEKFKSLSKKVRDKITKEENIETIAGMLLYKEKRQNLIEFLQHTIFGDVYNNKVFGIHHKSGVDGTKIRINKITKTANKYGVYEVELSRKDFRSLTDNNIKEWKTKTSTFFPDKWDYNKLIEECFFALQTKIKKEETEYTIKWFSRTKSGIPVIIYTNKKYKLQSIFPIYTEKNKKADL